MEKEITVETTDIYNYLYTMCMEKELSREEVKNLLQSSLEFVFQVNQLDISNYKIIIHDAKPVNSKKKITRLNAGESKTSSVQIQPYEACFMVQDEKDLNKYEIFFNIKDTVYKNTTEAFPINDEFKNVEPDTDFDNFTIFLYYAFHEFAHIVQYIRNPEEIEIYNDSKVSSYYNTLEYADTLDKKSREAVRKALKKHMDAKAINSWFEKNANAQAYDYLSILLNAFIETADDFTFKCYLQDMLLILRKMRKQEFKFYRYANKINKEAVTTLGNYGITEDELILD